MHFISSEKEGHALFPMLRRHRNPARLQWPMGDQSFS